jgi:formate dehydrogenase subunit delta
MHIEKLVSMANDIADFFNAENDKEVAAEGVKKHIQRSWDPRMRKAIIAHFQANGEGLSPLAAQAVKKLILMDTERHS